MLRKIKSGTKSRIINYGLPIVSAILLVLVYPRFNLEFLAWFALVPLFVALENQNLRERLFTGFIFGLVFFSAILYWLLRVTVPGTIVLILLMSLISAIFVLLYRPSFSVNLFSIVVVPAAWVVTEYLRAHLFTGFPWALLGYSQYLNLPIIQISDITGAYGVSFMIVMINFCIYALIRRLPSRRTYAVVALVLLAGTFFYGYSRLKQKYADTPLAVAVVQGNIPQQLKWDDRYEETIFNVYSSLSQKAAKTSPDIIIWPETSFPFLLGEDEGADQRIAALAQSTNSYLLVGAVREKNSLFYNSAVLISDEGKFIENYNKIHLVPFGEYVPLEKYVPWLRNRIDKPIGDFGSSSDFTLFRIKSERKTISSRAIVKDLKFNKFGVLICFEDIFPDLARTFVNKGASFLVNITNDAWFGKTSAPFQHVQSSVFRAVENRVPVVRAANTGVSCFINQKGRIIASVSEGDEQIFVEGYKQADICPVQIATVYTNVGDIFAYICFGIIIFSIVIGKRQRMSI